MAQLLMPKATAVWLVENTTLTFEQIADFCGLHALEVQGVADGEVAIGIVGLDPVTNGQLTREEIERCQADPSARLKMAKVTIPLPAPRTKGPRLTVSGQMVEASTTGTAGLRRLILHEASATAAPIATR